MTHDTIVALAVPRRRRPGARRRRSSSSVSPRRRRARAAPARSAIALWGYELWAAFVVAAIATGGSLFFSEIAHFVPCELCWFQRICMYPLSIIDAPRGARTATTASPRYLLPLPVVGAGVSVYHLLVENGVVEQAKALPDLGAGRLRDEWINEFGYMTIPTLALTAFVLLIGFLALAAAGGDDDAATLPADA